MTNALIGYTGFVGTTLLRQTTFENLYRSTNIAAIDQSSFDMVVCAGAPAQKWIANREPEADKQSIDKLIGHLQRIKCKTFVLISTVDVFKKPIGVDETTPVEENELHVYGLHRRQLEKFVASHFEDYLIVRLPGLVGPGLRKNVIFDLRNNNNLDLINSQAVFQFYPMVNLWWDIQIALTAKLKLIHLTAAPITVSEIALQGFGHSFEQVIDGNIATYDFQTCFAPIFGGQGLYQYNKKETVQAIRAYAQSEPVTLAITNGKSS